MFTFIRQANRLKGPALCSVLHGCLIDSLICGIALAVILTIELTSTSMNDTFYCFSYRCLYSYAVHKGNSASVFKLKI